MSKTGLYVIITDPVLSYTDIAKVCVAQGISMLQLRQKHLSDREVLAAASQIMAVTKGTNTRFVMNDRADLAKVSGADMLHLGQDDMPIELARSIVGDMPIGLSTHSIEQARSALAHNPAYIGFGPIFPTPTKANPDPAVGIELLSEVVSFTDVPVIAIGGVFPTNLAQILSTGVRHFAMVRHLMQTTQLDLRIEEIKEIETRFDLLVTTKKSIPLFSD